MAIVSPARLAPAPTQIVPIAPAAKAVCARGLLGAGLTLMVAALLWLTRTQYAMPPLCQADWWGIDPPAPSHWAQHLHFALPHPLPPAQWNRQFRAGVGLLWLGYGLVVCGARRTAPSLRTTLLLTAGFAFALALFAPPVLSTDVYAYAASGRLAVLYDQNPYVALPYSFLHWANDPVQYFLAWDLPTVYGPVWTALSVALVDALPHSWLWGQVLYLKLVEALALCGLAWSAGRIAEHVQPGRGRLAALLVGTCPLLLMEGTGSGHNDLLMMACLFAAFASFLERKHGRAGIWLGLAAGIKLLPLVLLPWLLLDIKRTLPDAPARRRAMFYLIAGMLLPLVLGYACFWHGSAIWDTLHRRTQNGHGGLLWAGLAYVAVSVWLGTRRRMPTPWLPAWSVWSAVFMLTGLGFAFPWYISWFWPALALRGGRAFQVLFAVVFVFAGIWESLYGTLRPVVLSAGH